MARKASFQVPRVNPVEHAKALVRSQGYDKAQQIADGCVNLDTASLLASDILPELKDAKSVSRTNAFWKNVASFMRKNLNPKRKVEAASVAN